MPTLETCRICRTPKWSSPIYAALSPAWRWGGRLLRRGSRPIGCLKALTFLQQYIVQRDGKYFPDPLKFDPSVSLQKPKRAAQGLLTSRSAEGAPMYRRVFCVDGGGACTGNAGQRWRLRVVEDQTIAVQPKITLRPKFAFKPWLRVAIPKPGRPAAGPVVLPHAFYSRLPGFGRPG